MSKSFENIRRDHDVQRELAIQIIATEGDSQERRELFEQFKQEVEAHAAVEEQVFYSALMAEEEGQEQSRHSTSEHKEVADMLDELTEMDMSSPGWVIQFKKLKDELFHHLEEEEEEVFDLADRLLDDAKADAIDIAFERKKEVAVS